MSCAGCCIVSLGAGLNQSNPAFVVDYMERLPLELRRGALPFAKNFIAAQIDPFFRYRSDSLDYFADTLAAPVVNVKGGAAALHFNLVKLLSKVPTKVHAVDSSYAAIKIPRRVLVGVALDESKAIAQCSFVNRLLFSNGWIRLVSSYE